MSSPYHGTRLGSRFGPYELQSLIGVGGMGEVYRAYDTTKDRTVAVKLLRADMAADPAFQERFRRESRAAARLQEPHVIPVHDFGEIDGVLYIDMRLVEGGSLKDLLRTGGPLEPKRAASIIAQVAAALDAAHADGLVHRDIKPENVLLTADDFAYLVDFGIAHVDGDAGITRTGLLVGSCAYMAAERFSGGAVGPQSDVYSLTCVLYECLTGRPPYDTGDLRQLMSAHMLAPPPRPSAVRRGISRAFDDVIAKGMAKQPTDRYSSAGELARAATAAASSAPASAAAVVARPTQPGGTRQFSAVYPNPAATGYTPYPPAPARRPRPSARRSGLSRGQLVLVAATIVMFGVAAALATVLVLSNQQSTSPPVASPVGPPPGATTETTTSPTTTTTTTTPSPTTAAVPETDRQGFVGHSARCDRGSEPAAVVRTAQSLAVVCQTGRNDFYYRGERLSDGASIELANAVRASGGFNVTNPADGTRYEVRPDRLTIISNGNIDASEPVLQYGAR